jgi:enamine deaminase RidA (YjgF/YER057c/UK114 family)
MPTIAQRLLDLGLTMPTPAKAVAAYVPFVITGNLIFISGQLPKENDKLTATGLLGKDVDLIAGQKAAEVCALNILAHLDAAVGGKSERVERCVKLTGFVASAPGFYDQPKVINGASELMEKVFGEAGKHARAAVGVSALPMNAAVEVEAIFAIKP